MLTLSTPHDPVIPRFNQLAYGGAVAAEGQSDLLVQRSINRYGHCQILPQELVRGVLGSRLVGGGRH